MKKLVPIGLASAVAVGGLAALAAPSAQALASPVDIRVEHSLVGGEPRVLERTGVRTGPGPEVTEADETANPSSYGGNVLVDVDPVTRTVKVVVEDSNCYDDVTVRLTSAEVVTLTAVTDGLWESPENLTRTITRAGDTTSISWQTADGASGCPSLADDGAFASFSYVAKPSVVTGLAVSGKAAAVTRTVSWKAPASPGAPTVSYRVTLRSGTRTVVSTTTSATSLKVGRDVLRPGKHTVSVATVNSVGTSAPAVATFKVAKIKPGKVQDVQVKGKNGAKKRTIAWTAPWNGGAKITAYRVVVKKFKVTLVDEVVRGKKRSLKVSRAELAAGRHTVKVTAKNKLGTGKAGKAAFKVKK